MNQISSLSNHNTCGSETGLITVDQAFQHIISKTHSLGHENLALNEALNRYIAEDIYSQIDLPIFSQSAVDGYAIASNRAIYTGDRFKLVGEIRAGEKPLNFKLAHGQAVRILTGAAIPAQTYTVARQEIVHVEGNEIVITQDLTEHVDIRDQGEEIKIGQCIAKQGKQLSVGAITALSMAGVQQVQVMKYPKIVAVITGDEVAENIADYQDGMIYDANAPLIRAWFQAQQQSIEIIHVVDDEAAVRQLFERLKEQYDLVISTGGVSVGDYDFIRPVSLDLGFQQIFWKVKQKPGKPLFFAQYQRADRTAQQSQKKIDASSELHNQSIASQKCYLLALPGNPAAVYMGIQLYVRQILQCLQGQKTLLPWITAIISHDLKADSRERFLRMQLHVDDGVMKLQSLAKQQSHMLSNLLHANCIVRVPAGQPVHAGQILETYLI